MNAHISGPTRRIIQSVVTLLLVAMTGIAAHAQAPVGDRPDISAFTAAQRADLFTQMSNYISSAVILQHLDPPNDKHGSSRFLVWHRNYIKALEDYLISQNRPQFVPLPRWDPSTPIPPEFLVGGGVDVDCPTTVYLAHNCNPLVNANPGVNLPTSLGPQLCSQLPFATFRSTLESTFHNPVHGAVGGAMGAFKSPAAPIFWLWHAFVDDVWFDWQCLCGLDEGSAFSLYTAAEQNTNLDAGVADAWIQDSPTDLANEPNNDTGPVLWASQDIWVRNSQDTRVGTTRFLHEHQHENPEYASIPANRPYIYVKVRNRGCMTISGAVHVYWANASTGLLWPASFTEVSTSPVTLTSISAGREQVAEFHWLDIPQPTTTTGHHFCLVARFVASPASADPINGEVTGVDVSQSVKNSNQTAWKNLTVVDDVLNNPLIVRNISLAGNLLSLRFTIPPDQADHPFFDHGAVVIELGDPLFTRWVQNGAMGTGIEYNACGQVRALAPDATIEGLPMTFNEEHLINLAFVPGAPGVTPPCEDDRVVFQVNVNAFEGQTLLGGNTYEIHPGVILPSPVVAIAALDPQMNCAGAGVALHVASSPPPGATVQWLQDDVPIPNATGLQYLATQSGRYSLLMTYNNGCDRLSDPLAVHIGTPPANDSPCAATVAPLGEMVDFDIYCATRQAGEVTPGAGSGSTGGCFSRDGWCERDTLVQNSVWFRFTAPPSRTVTIHAGEMDHEGGHDDIVNTQLAVWQVGNCANYATYHLIAANDDSGDEGMWGTDPVLHDLDGLTPGTDYYVQIDGYLGAGGKGMLMVEDNGPTDVPEDSGSGALPSEVRISEVSPNPSTGRFVLRLALPQAARVDLRLIDVAGRAVARQTFGTLDAGYHDLTWDTAKSGARIPRGVYYIEVQADEERRVRKVVLR